MRLTEEMQTLAQGLVEVNEHAAKYPDELQPFMSHFLMTRFMIGSKARTDGWRHATYQDLLLEHGVLRHAPFFVPDEPVLARAEPQNCYLNSYNAVCELPDYTYVEGFAQTNLLLVQHAWLEDPDGNVVDPTWALLGDDRLEEYSWNITPTYYGIRFDTDFVLRNASTTGWCSMFARDWEHAPDFPSLRFGFIFDDRGFATDYNREVST